MVEKNGETIMIEEMILKHKDIPLVTFMIDNESYEIVDIKNIKNKEHLPFILSGIGDDKILVVQKLSHWLKHRGISESRSDYGNIMVHEKTGSNIELSLRSFGLALDDHYWIHKTKSNVDWNNVNYFDNIVKNMIRSRIYPSDSDEDQSSIHPDFSTGGNLIKGWVYDKKDWVLLKESMTFAQQEPYNEVIVSKILDEWKFDHVKYGKKKLNGRQVSVCKCMTDKDTELIPARFVFDFGKASLINRYEDYIAICEKQGIADTREKIDGMIALDFFIGNTDRHTRNFGIIRNADTLQWLKIAPLFDNGNSLCFRDALHGAIKSKVDSFCKWNNSSNLKMLEKIEYPSWYNEAKGNRVVDIVDYGLQYNKDIDEKKRDKIIKIVRERIKVFNALIKEKPRAIYTGMALPRKKEKAQ